jgi:hypothetical protein
MPAGARTLPAAARLRWAALLERVFGADVIACPRCGDRLAVLAFLIDTDPDVTLRVLDHLGLPRDRTTIAPARAPPRLPFDDPA